MTLTIAEKPPVPQKIFGVRGRQVDLWERRQIGARYSKKDLSWLVFWRKICYKAHSGRVLAGGVPKIGQYV